jgi:flagellar capping protein FliD
MQSASGSINNNSTTGIFSLFDIGVILSGQTPAVDIYDQIGQLDPTRAVAAMSSGSLMIDSTVSPLHYDGTTKLNWMLQNDFNGVKDFFTNPNSGFNATMNEVINTSINAQDEDASIWNATNNIQSQVKEENTQMLREQARLMDVRQELVQKFAVVNGMIDKFKNLSTFMDRQFSSLENIGKK